VILAPGAKRSRLAHLAAAPGWLTAASRKEGARQTGGRDQKDEGEDRDRDQGQDEDQDEDQAEEQQRLAARPDVRKTTTRGRRQLRTRTSTPPRLPPP